MLGMKCPKTYCEGKMIWQDDWEEEEEKGLFRFSRWLCSKCETDVTFKDEVKEVNA